MSHLRDGNALPVTAGVYFGLPSQTLGFYIYDVVGISKIRDRIHRLCCRGPPKQLTLGCNASCVSIFVHLLAYDVMSQIGVVLRMFG